ncbi:hypothetical protein VNO77_42931 [Canavalia gladiata]|uniref:Uncharacterized protein n=1 Tax=Canavalia gladiata TaxID=3824 RepID=A0AAN9JW65_CANGL
MFCVCVDLVCVPNGGSVSGEGESLFEARVALPSLSYVLFSHKLRWRKNTHKSKQTLTTHTPLERENPLKTITTVIAITFLSLSKNLSPSPIFTVHVYLFFAFLLIVIFVFNHSWQLHSTGSP